MSYPFGWARVAQAGALQTGRSIELLRKGYIVSELIHSVTAFRTSAIANSAIFGRLR